jgi:hypothetical protein
MGVVRSLLAAKIRFPVPSAAVCPWFIRRVFGLKLFIDAQASIKFPSTEK